MMKAIVYYKNGGPEVFQWTDVDVLACGPDQVVIKNEYISIEGGDLIAREIMPPERVPHIVGYQSAGEIVEVGADVQDRWVGQKVVTIVTSGSYAAWGSHAEFTVTAANMTWVIPAALSVDIGAAIPVTFGTAHECLFEFGHMRGGQSVLIHASAGALGLATLQLAKRAGARVFTTASDDAKLARLKADFAVDVTINYVKQDFFEGRGDWSFGNGEASLSSAVAEAPRIG
jgi:NADPH2:quinone reductase